MPNAPLTSADIQKIHDSYARTGSLSKTALETGFNRGTVSKYVAIGHPAPVTERPHLSTSADTLSQPTLPELLTAERLTVSELCERLDCAPSVVRELLVSTAGVQREGDRYWIESAKELPKEIVADREARKAKAEAAETKAKYDSLLAAHDDLERQLEFALHIKSNFRPAQIEVNPSITGGQGTVIALASDWHVGQRVDATTVSGLNEFNPDIAERRAKAFFRNLLALVRKERHDVAIENLILWLGGDLISNVIHPELLETNYLSPFQEAELAQNLIAGGLKLLAEDGEFQRITLVCNSGNHGRSTHRVHHASETLNSYEHAIYWNLRRNFPEMDWQIATGYFHYLEIYGQLHRFHHGHNTKYGGGVGGLTIPLIKFIHRANQQRYAVHDWLGHYHTLTRHPDFTINGSLVGFCPYALSIGARPERPQQVFQLVDAKRGFTIAAPILLDE